jgi:hypothetical protein
MFCNNRNIHLNSILWFRSSNRRIFHNYHRMNKKNYMFFQFKQLDRILCSNLCMLLRTRLHQLLLILLRRNPILLDHLPTYQLNIPKVWVHILLHQHITLSMGHCNYQDYNHTYFGVNLPWVWLLLRRVFLELRIYHYLSSKV